MKKIIKKHPLPSLDFYFKSGFDPKAVKELKLPGEEEPNSLIEAVLAIESTLNKETADKEKELLQETIAIIRAIETRVSETQIAIEQLCLEAYLSLL